MALAFRPIRRSATLDLVRDPNHIASLPPSGQPRLHEMDGLRGWAALSVMLFHVFWETFGKAEPSFRTPLLAMFLNGWMDVAVFFVLSGDALSASYWRRQSHEGVAKLAIKRYFRLAVPVFASCLMVLILMKSGLIFSHQAAAIVGRQDWLGIFLTYDQSVSSLFIYSGAGVFFLPTDGGSFNPFLWTMQVEFLGSLLVFCYLLLDENICQKTTCLIFIFLVCLAGRSYLACFVFGVLCGRLRALGVLAWLRARVVPQLLAVPAAGIAAAAGAWFNAVRPGSHLAIVITACALVFGVYASVPLSRFCANRFSRWLGRISFPLYLVHFPVIVSFTSGLVVLTHDQGVFGPAAIWSIALGSVALSLLAAVLFMPVETLTAWIGDFVCRAVMCSNATIVRAAPPPVTGLNRRLSTPVSE